LHLQEGFIFASPSYQRLDSLSYDLSDSYTYHMSTVDLGSLHRRLRRGRNPDCNWGNHSSIHTYRSFSSCNYSQITPPTRAYAYYGPFSACYLWAAVAFWHIHRSFRPLGCLTAFLVHHLLGWLDRLIGFGFGANNKRLPSDDAIDFRHFCTTHTLLEVHEGLRAMLTGVCKEIPYGFQA
jgi:hypothetical protein